MTHEEQVPPALRRDVYDRDGGCLVCGKPERTIQRRQATGMGGSRIRLKPSELLVLCLVHNQGCESWMQTEALTWGVKVRKNIGGTPCRAVPVYSNADRCWYRLDDEGKKSFLHPEIAHDMMRAVYGPEWDEWRDSVLDVNGVIA